MAKNIIKNIPLNRVEGDLEIKVEINDGTVTDAWSSGIMFRGFERILNGRGALDGLVITPRICGICNTCHLKAAAKALDVVAGVTIPDDAKRIRNVVLMTEHIMSDMRHGFLIFSVDFTNPVYSKHSLFEEAVRRYEPFKGQTVLETIRETKSVLEIIAILGGQWPHSAVMVPGGVASIPDRSDLLTCGVLLDRYRQWYETRILGCSLERWNDVKSADDLANWLDESDSHRNSDLGFYIRFADEAGLVGMGTGFGNFICYGAFDMPSQTEVKGAGDSKTLVPGGFIKNGQSAVGFTQEKVSEHVYHSWFKDYDGGRHPFKGETEPYATGGEGRKYSWAKAPRYENLPAETGPLAEMVIGNSPLFTDLIRNTGPNVYVRELARLVRPALYIPAMSIWLKEIRTENEDYYESPGEIESGEGFGLTHAARGALGHWVIINNGKIQHYQIITPTAWNASPRDSEGVRGPWEEALVNTRVRDINNPVEVGHVVRSFDACLVCTVHTLHKTGHLSEINL